ncbi:MFS transporter [Microtetraspora niveoalba]|uniref:MFS transporter n=1 Tax=Microtetraspora niveoalba TaxID=46175 RepID=UPI000A9CBCA0|nr:MFS transporter [Microtetraspora niveoalba]
MTSPHVEPASPGLAPRGRRAVSDRRVIVIVVGTQLAISLGYYAMMAHLVAHLHRDLGILAGTVTAVLGVRVAVQYMLFLPVGALTDVIGPARAGFLACLCAAVVMAVGGALFHPAAQSLLAGVAPARRARGFAAYLVTGELAAVVGPPLGLLLLLTGGFGLLAAVTSGAWAAGAVLFTLLRRAPGAAPRTETGAARPDPRRLVAGVSAVLRDRGFVLFASARRPRSRRPAARTPPRAGRYLMLVVLPPGAGGRIAVLAVAAVLHGLASGLTQAALFQTVTRCAPPGRFGGYTGLLNFLAGLVALAGSFAVGPLFDGGHRGATTALAALGLVAAVTAAAVRSPAAPTR